MELAYVAGLFDGEGSVGVYKVKNGRNTESGEKYYYAGRMAILGLYRPVFLKLHKFFGYGTLTTQKRQALARTPGKTYDPRLCRQGWKWFITNKKDLRNFLIQIYPYLHEKKQQVKIVLDFIDGDIDGPTAEKLCKEAKRFEFHGEEIHHRSSMKGSDNPFAKLNEADVVRIKRRLAKGDKQSVLSREYNINKTTMSRIARGLSWSHVTI